MVLVVVVRSDGVDGGGVFFAVVFIRPKQPFQGSVPSQCPTSHCPIRSRQIGQSTLRTTCPIPSRPIRQSTLRTTCPMLSCPTIHVTHNLSDTQPLDNPRYTQIIVRYATVRKRSRYTKSPYQKRLWWTYIIFRSSYQSQCTALHCNCSQDIGLPSDRQRQVNCKTKCTIITSKHHKAIF